MTSQPMTRRRYTILVATVTASILTSGTAVYVALHSLFTKAFTSGGLYIPAALILAGYLAATLWIGTRAWRHARYVAAAPKTIRSDCFDLESTLVAIGCLLAGTVGVSNEAPLLASAAIALAGVGALAMFHISVNAWVRA